MSLQDINDAAPAMNALTAAIQNYWDNREAEFADYLGWQSDNLPIYLMLSDDGEAAQTYPADVQTRVTNMVAVDGNGGAGWDGARYTVDAATAGLYYVSARLNIGNEDGEEHDIKKNGAKVWGVRFSATSGNHNVTDMSAVVSLADGDYVEVFLTSLNVDKDSNGNFASLLRVAPASN